MLGVQLENPSLKLANPDWQVDYLNRSTEPTYSVILLLVVKCKKIRTFSVFLTLK